MCACALHVLTSGQLRIQGAMSQTHTPFMEEHARRSACVLSAHFSDSTEPPMVMHYGLEFNIPDTGYTWDKHWFYSFDALKCPPWGLDPKVRSMGGLFNHPPMPSELKSKVR